MILETAVKDVEELVSDWTAKISVELGGKEKDLASSLTPSENGGGKVLDGKSQSTLIDLLIALPHGVEAMNYDIEGLVETSNNLATIAMDETAAKIGTSTRSSIKTALQALRDRISAAARLAGAEVVENEPYPGWMPNVDSDLLKVFQGVHKEVFGEEPKTIAIHAGLECGIIGEKFPGMDMVSLGPTLEAVHSPEEKIYLDTVERFWDYLLEILKSIG